MDGTFGVMKLGNTQLVNYGIQSEESDIRAHVSIATRHVYIYSTKLGLGIIAQPNGYRLVPVYTGNIQTAKGYLVPPGDIPGCEHVSIPDDVFVDVKFSIRDNTSEKGRKAVLVVRQMLKRGLLPIDLKVEEIDDEAIQISGTDIIVSTKVKIQVKCDWKAGHRELGGTGNLFLQVAECNPLGMH